MEIQEQFKALHEKLSTEISWPHVYMFKFIIPAVNTSELSQLLAHFPSDAEIDYKQSSSAKYISVTIKEKHQSADNVIKKYQEISKIQGVMSL